MKNQVRGVKVAALGVLVAVLTTAVAVAALPNGGFESGNLSRWKTIEPGGGEWSVYSGTGSPLPPPPRGQFAAIVTQGGPGLNILHRVLRLKPDAVNRLSLFFAYENPFGDQFYTPRTFEFDLDAGAPRNEQFRIDLLKPRAPVDSLRDRHILANLYRVRNDDPLHRDYRRLRANLTELGLEGRVRLRIAEVDNQSPLYLGIDAVKLKSRARG